MISTFSNQDELRRLLDSSIRSEKAPAQIACDLESLVDSYNEKWGQKKIVLMGYSMGAEVLPFAVNCMKDKYIQALDDLILIGPWQKATFHDFLGGGHHFGDDYISLSKLIGRRLNLE